MINLEIYLNKFKDDYPDFFNFFKNVLLNSDSKYKHYDESKYRCYYHIGFYLKSEQKNDEYYKNIYNMKWEDRMKEEYSKVRITVTLKVGNFVISDQTNYITDNIKSFLNEAISRKMYVEQNYYSNNPNYDILNSIPNIDDIKIMYDQEIKNQMNFIESIFQKSGKDLIKKHNNLSPKEMLENLIRDEKYEEANVLINEYPELKI